jgi:hypothetical protein
VIADMVQYANGEPRLIEQFWHCGSEVTLESAGLWRVGGTAAVLAVPAASKARTETGGLSGWRSESPGNRIESSVIVVEQTSIRPAVMAAALFLRPEEVTGKPWIETDAGDASIIIRAGDRLSVRLRNGDDPELTWS